MRLIYTVLAVAMLVIAGCHPFDNEANLPLEQALQKALDESIKDSGIKGVSAAVILPDDRLWQGASGVSYGDVPITTEMLFDIGSAEKNLQAALTLMLVEEGLLSLDDPVEKWLPSTPNIDGKITVRQLLNMTSGLDRIVDDPNSPWRVGYRNIDFEKEWTWSEICDSFVSRPIFAPGTGCDYGVTNYLVLKQICQRVTNSQLTSEFKKRIVGPFALDHTFVDFSQPTPDSLHIADGWYDIDGDGTAEDITANSLNWVASLSPLLIYSTPGDMARWIDDLLHKKTVLKDETLKEMLTFQGPVRKEPMMNGYGLGIVDINLWMLLPKWRDVRAYGHLGSQFGYSTFVAYFPQIGVSAALMFNRGADRESDRAGGTIMGAFFDTLFRRLGVQERNQLNAISDFEEELQNTPENIHLMYRIARMYQGQGENEKALSMFEKMLNKDPEDHYGYLTNALYWRAFLYASLKRQPDYLISFIATHPDYPNLQDAYKVLADTYRQRNEIAKGIAVYNEAVRIYKGDAFLLNSAAWWIFENKIESEYTTAIGYAEEAASLAPGESSIWDTLAQLYNVTGQRQKAVEASERALSLAPADRHEEYRSYLDKIRDSK